MSTFGGIEQAGSALEAARYGLQIVSQNIANADTPGYTRQAAQQGTVDAVAGVPTIYTRPTGPGGVRITGTSRMNDPVIDARLRAEQAKSGLADTTASQLSQLESVFPEPSDTGLSEQLNDFWNAWADVANDPGSDAARTVLLHSAATVSATLNSMSGALTDLAASVQQRLGDDTDAATTAAGQLATLNGQIAVASASGTDVNSLLDRRDVLLGQLSSLVGATATFNSNGSVDVTVAGQTLVTGTTAAVVTADPTGQVLVGGTAVSLGGGTAAAEATALTTTIPGYSSQLDGVADALASTVNSGQAAGFDRAGNPGAPIFAGSGAAGISVALTDPAGIAASGTPGGNLDGSNALAMSAMGRSSTGADAAYTTLVGDVASASAQAQQQQATQDAVTNSVRALQQSSSGVSYDEAVSAMLSYQQSFNAASRVLTTFDDMLDTLINHTGLVGRA